MMNLVLFRSGFRMFRNLSVGVSCGGILLLLLLSGAGCHRPTQRILVGPHVGHVSPTSVVLVWETARPTVSKVTYAPEEGGTPFQKIDVQRTRVHQVRLQGLRPGTRYTYTISSGFATASGWFRTSPEPGKPFRFAVYGDDGRDPETHRKLAQVLQYAAPDFVLNTAIPAQTLDTLADWQRFFAPLSGVLSHAPLYPCLSPSPTSRRWQRRWFPLPGDSDPGVSWYTFDYGNVRFVVLDSSGPPETYAPGSPQFRWLEKTLAKNPQTWTCVLFHHPPYSSGPGGSFPALRRAWDALFLKYGVDLVFSDHEAIYERSYPLQKLFDRQESPITYCVTGGGGTAPDSIHPQVWTAHTSPLRHCIMVEVEGERLDLVAYSEQGEVLDAMTVYKHKGRAIYEEEPVAYEQIEWEQSLRENVKLPVVVIREDRLSIQDLTLDLSNPLPIPIALSLSWDLSSDTSWSVSPSRVDLTVKPKQRTTATFRLAAQPARLYPTPQLRVTYQAPLGQGEVALEPLRVGFKRRLDCPLLEGRINLYGRRVEPAWRNAARTTEPFVLEKIPGEARYQTVVYAGRDDRAFYFALDLADPDATRLTAHLNTVDLDQDDAAAIVLGPPEGAWIQFAFNADGVQRASEPGIPWQVGVSRRNKGWSAEVRIPFESVGQTPAPGEVWRIQFLRNSRLEGRSVWCLTGESPALGEFVIR